jgi:2-keto-4-pentenoate hydratase/2-oxohepta-3-ene-1,7-dioic acid hydratase in catechol pathway
VDYECELAVVIGKRCKNVSRADALDYVLGYTCANDVSARDWHATAAAASGARARASTPSARSARCSSRATRSRIRTPSASARFSTARHAGLEHDDMIFDVPAIIEFLSSSKTLLPGTVILTGTPHGVGFARNPPVWLKAGDSVSIEIEKIGTLTNPVINEPSLKD